MFTRRYARERSPEVWGADADSVAGIIHQAGLPSCHVLFLSLQHDRGTYPGREQLTWEARPTRNGPWKLFLIRTSSVG